MASTSEFHSLKAIYHLYTLPLLQNFLRALRIRAIILSDSTKSQSLQMHQSLSSSMKRLVRGRIRARDAMQSVTIAFSAPSGSRRGLQSCIMQAEKGFRQQEAKSSLPSPTSSSSTPPAKTPQVTPSSPTSSPSTPQRVVDRMFIRMVSFAALPVMLGVLSLPVFIYLKNSNEDFPIWVVYIAQNIIWGGGLLGITYGIISTSWDPTREGSLLGWDEFKSNLPVLLNKNKQ
jgi:hypothetical protein